MNKSELKAALEQQRPRITSLYGQEQVERQIARYGQLIDDYERAFGNMDCALFSAPGRRSAATIPIISTAGFWRPV